MGLLGSRRPKFFFLSVVLMLLIGFAPRASAFTTYQAATIVIGESSFTDFNPAVTQTGLITPIGLTTDTAGNLWVADQGANRILEYKAPLSTFEAASVVLGQTSFTGNGFGTSATTLDAPQGLAFDHNGNLWVVDTSNNRVVEYAPPFTTGEAASLVIGQSSFTSNAAVTNRSGFNQPEAIAFGPAGNMWVADTLNSRALLFKTPFSTGENATVVLGEPNFVTAIDQVTQNGLAAPNGLAFDSGGNLWVVDGVRALEFTTPFSTNQNASIVIGQNNFTNSSTVASASGVDLPWALAFDASNNLWVADYGNNRVLQYTTPFSNGEAASVVIGQPNFTSNTANPVFSPTATSLNHPYGLVFDPSGDMLISDYAQGRVLGYGTGFAAGGGTTTSSSSSSTSSSSTSTSSSTTLPTSGTSTTPSTSATSTTPSASSTTSSGGGGGVPVFPYSALAATVFTGLLVAGYLLARRMSPIRPTP